MPHAPTLPDPATAEGDLWVFGYGSLMWNPGFPHLETAQARLPGWHRALCIYSWVHRGTPDRPGLVLGLDRGGSCRGMAFRVAAADRAATVAYLREREQVTSVYIEAVKQVVLVDGHQHRVDALCYVADRSQPQYAGQLSDDDILRYVRQGKGKSGANPDYVLSTVDHMRASGIPDRHLYRLAERLTSGG